MMTTFTRQVLSCETHAAVLPVALDSDVGLFALLCLDYFYWPSHESRLDVATDLLAAGGQENHQRS